MAVQQLLLPGEIVKKSNDLVRNKVSISSVQAARILASLISSIRTDDKTLDKIYCVYIKDLLPNESGKSYREIKSTIKDLARSFFEEEIDNVVENDIFLAETPFFSRITYSKGVVKALFNPLLAPQLLHLNGLFTQYNLIEYLKLPSIYSQRLFEILKSWSNTEQEIKLTVESLHETLATPESFRANFKDFRRWVLEKAHKDITDKTSLRYEWEPVKQGRAVVAIRFIFARGKALAITTRSKAAKEEKARQSRNELGLLALACFKERGNSCEGGHQKESVCEACRKIR